MSTSTAAPGATAAAHGTSLASLEAREITAWFGSHKVLDRVSLTMPAGDDHRADRPVGLRQVDVPAHPQPDARAGPLGGAGRGGAARRPGHLRRRPQADRRTPQHRHGLPEAQPVPRHVHQGQRPRRAEADGHAGVAQRAPGPRRAQPDPGRPLEGGPGPARRTRRRTLRWPAAAPVHRPVPGGPTPGAADGRAVLGARPDLDPGHRGDDAPARRGGDDRDRHPQHAAGGPRVEAAAPSSSPPTAHRA